ncbi:MAG: hypothetical protein ACOCVR_00975, partial [Myxococcota bacterium]
MLKLTSRGPIVAAAAAVLALSSCKKEEPLPEVPLTEAEGRVEVVEAAWPEGGASGTFTVSDLSAPPKDGDIGWWPAVAVSADGAVHLAYTDAYNGAVHHAERVDGEWKITAVDSAGAVGKYPAIALAADGTPHVIYYNQDNRILRHAARLGGNAVDPEDRRRPPQAHEDWVYEVVDQGFEIGMAGQLVFGPDGTLHAVYYGPEQRLVHAWRPPVADGERGRWERRIIDREAAGSHSIVIGLALGRDGALHVSYANWLVASSELRYARLAPGADEWDVEKVRGVENAGWKSGIVLDEEDRPLIAYLLLEERRLYLARPESEGWEHVVLVGDANTMSFTRAEDGGSLLLAYEHLPGRGLSGAGVRLLQRADSRGALDDGWVAAEVPDGMMSTYMDAALGAGGRPVAAFYKGDIRGVAVFEASRPLIEAAPPVTDEDAEQADPAGEVNGAGEEGQAEEPAEEGSLEGESERAEREAESSSEVESELPEPSV